MLYVIIIILIAVNILLDLKLKNKDNEEIKINENTDYKEHYSKKDYLLTPTELKFYKLLKSIIDNLDYSLFVQIPLYELVNYKEYKDFNKIKSKSIDFVVTEKNCKVKLCIELDDKSHNYNSRIQRDKFVNKLFSDIGIKLIRIPVQNFYNLEELEKKIIE